MSKKPDSNYIGMENGQENCDLSQNRFCLPAGRKAGIQKTSETLDSRLHGYPYEPVAQKGP